MHSSFRFVLIKVFDYRLMAGRHHGKKPFASHYVSFAKKKLSSRPAPEFMPTFYLLLSG